MSYTLNIERNKSLPLKGLRWCLDFPIQGETATFKQLAEEGVWFQGWLILPSNIKGELLLENDINFKLDLDRKRPDVIECILRTNPVGHSQLSCGFRQKLVLSKKNTLYFIYENKRVVLANIEVNTATTPVEGNDNWLFLDNDTNRSVEQFTGNLLVNGAEMNAWQTYFDKLARLAQVTNVTAAQVLVAPSKEFVYEEYYPYKRAQITPIEQVMALSGVKPYLFYPLGQLQGSADRTFRVTDTHWSCYGARIAALGIYERFGFDVLDALKRFEADVYTSRQMVGDLGNKFFPPRSSEEFVLQNYSHRRFTIFDNELPNYGRIRVIEQPDALQPFHCLVFGGSSSYSMLDYLSRLFKTVTLVHTAANIDETILNELEVDYLIAQTNARFVVRAPHHGYSLKNIFTEKFLSLDIQQQESLIFKIDSLASNCRHKTVSKFIQWQQSWIKECMC